MIAERFKYMPIVAVIIAIVMTVLDGTIMNVALPSLTKEFKIEPNTVIWLINIYQMVIMMLLLVFATIGDILAIGRYSCADSACLPSHRHFALFLGISNRLSYPARFKALGLLPS